ELQPALSRRFGERSDPSVVAIASPVEDDGLDSGLLRPLGDQRADSAGGVPVGSPRRVLPQPRIQRGGVRQGRPAAVVDDLGVDVPSALVDREPGPFLAAADPRADANTDAPARLGSRLRSIHYLPPA